MSISHACADISLNPNDDLSKGVVGVVFHAEFIFTVTNISIVTLNQRCCQGKHVTFETMADVAN